MRIIVDADACPGISLITEVAKKYNIELILYADYTHNIVSDYAKVIVVSKGFQNVDTVISNDVKEWDILITQDFGLAVIGLSKKASVIHTKGMIYTNDNIDTLLFERHLNSKLRKRGGHSKGPKKRTKEDDIKLINSLESIIKEATL